jgi:hypothetical protein
VRPLGTGLNPTVTTVDPQSEVSLTDSPQRAYVRVTQGVVAQINRVGRSQAQIALKGFPQGTKRTPVGVMVHFEDGEYRIIIGDSHAAWASHQRGVTVEPFEYLFALLSDRPDVWTPVRYEMAVLA